MKKLLALSLAATMVFTNSILAGETLVRDAITSEGFVSGSTGWSINRDGTAEFSDIISRGSLIAGPNPGTHIEINGDDYPGEIAIFSGNADENIPGRIFPGNPSSNAGSITLRSPNLFDSVETNVAELQLEGFDTGNTVLSGEADTVRLTATTLQGIADTIKLGDSTASGDLVIEYDGQQQIIRNEDETWHNITLQNSWVQDSASVTPQYMKDANGNVHVRGAVKSGTTTVIGTLPAGYRPTGQVYFTPAQHAGTSTAASHIQVGTDGVLTITTNLVSAQTRLRLGFTFPTFN